MITLVSLGYLLGCQVKDCNMRLKVTVSTNGGAHDLPIEGIQEKAVKKDWQVIITDKLECYCPKHRHQKV